VSDSTVGCTTADEVEEVGTAVEEGEEEEVLLGCGTAVDSVMSGEQLK
jgi:hypothetical protein